MAKKTEAKIEKEERIYVIPLREKCRVVPRYKKTNKAMKTVKEFLVKHMKIRDRDLNKIKIDKYLNEAMWSRGIKKPPHKIKVKAIKQGDIVTAELVDFPDKLKFKKLKEEKIKKMAEEKGKKKKAEAEAAAKAAGSEQDSDLTRPGEAEPKKEDADTKEAKDSDPDQVSSAKDVERKKTEKEKAAAGAEAQQKVAESQAKIQKKQKQPSMKQPKRQVRKALAK